MRRLTSRLVLALTLVLVTSCAQATDGRPTKRPNLFFLGDSITADYYSSAPSAGYRADFTRAVAGHQAALVGGPGQTVAQVLAEAAQLPPTAADTVVIELGTNDLIHQTPLSAVGASYSQLIKTALGLSAPHPLLLCVGLWAPPQLAAAYDAVLRPICAASGGRWVRVADLFTRPELRGPPGARSYLGPADDFHPNDRGHAAIAQRLLAAYRAGRP